jgi:CRISPR-associated protein Cmr1
MFYISRFKDIERREYQCEVVTPLFLGAADPRKTELRTAPIKAALRFWWRALYRDDNPNEMTERESKIFGSTERISAINTQINCQNLNITLKNLPQGKMVPVEGKTYKISIIHYLSYGLFEYNREKRSNIYIKNHIEPGAYFEIHMTFPKDLESEISMAFKAFISFGGIGARSRNGFGSLYAKRYVDHTINNKGHLKSFTSFSSKARIFNKFGSYDCWEDALSEIGEIYRNARLKLENRHTWHKRKYIGMPIEAQRENIPDSIRKGRHAKPYFLHVNKTTDGKYQGQILFLPYLYKAAPDDNEDKTQEYLEVCGKMNEEIERGMGGSK